jgi:hypothetical protein
MDPLRVVEDAFRECRLPRVNVGADADIPYFSDIPFHGVQSLFSKTKKSLIRKSHRMGDFKTALFATEIGFLMEFLSFVKEFSSCDRPGKP